MAQQTAQAWQPAFDPQNQCILVLSVSTCGTYVPTYMYHTYTLTHTHNSDY